MRLILPALFYSSLNFFATSAWAQDTLYLSELDGLIEKGKQESLACRAFEKKWKKLGAKNDKPAHESKEQALKVLALLETIPGVAPSFVKARTHFLENQKALRKEADGEALGKRYSEIEGECAIVPMLHHSQMLLADIDTLSLDAATSMRIRSYVKKYLRSNLPFQSLLSASVRGAVLDTYLQATAPVEKKAHLHKLTEDYAMDFEGRRELVTDKHREHYSKDIEFDAAASYFEGERVNELSNKYRRMLWEVREYM